MRGGVEDALLDHVAFGRLKVHTDVRFVNVKRFLVKECNIAKAERRWYFQRRK